MPPGQRRPDWSRSQAASRGAQPYSEVRVNLVAQTVRSWRHIRIVVVWTFRLTQPATGTSGGLDAAPQTPRQDRGSAGSAGGQGCYHHYVPRLQLHAASSRRPRSGDRLMQPVVHLRTLVDVISPAAVSRQRDIVLVLAFGTLMGLLAQVAVPLPFTPVPVTGQTLGVLLIGALLGSRRGGAAMLVYLAEGLAGLPVFSEGTTAWTLTRLGVPVIVGPTAGYLLAFPVAAFVVGWLAERGWDRRLSTAACAMLLGQAIIYAGGLSWLSYFVGLDRAVPLGMLPFLSGDAVKLVLAAVALPGGWQLLSRLGVPAVRP